MCSAVGDGKSEQKGGMRWRGKGKERGWGKRDCSSPPVLRGSDT